MKQELLALLKQVTPPILWSTAKGLVGPKRQGYYGLRYQGVQTLYNAKPLHVGRFANLYERYYSLDPNVPVNVTRYRLYNVCMFAYLCRNVPGDFIAAGVSFGVSQRVLYDFLNFPKLNKTFHFIDPFLGIQDANTEKKQVQYNTDINYVRGQYTDDAPIRFHKQLIPKALPLPNVHGIAFVSLDTSDPASEAASLPVLYDALSTGGAITMEDYGFDNFEIYDPAFQRIGVEPFWLPSGQCVIWKV